MNSSQRSAADTERRRLLRTFGDNVRAHFSERLDYAVHRAAGEGWITDQSRFKSLTGKQTGEQTHGCAGAAAIDLVFWRCQEAFLPVNNENVRFGLFNLNSERSQCADGMHAIVAREKPAHVAKAIRKSSNDSGAM